MNFDRNKEDAFKRQPSLNRLLDILEDREAKVQAMVNSCTEDHRYWQGLLQSIKDLLKLYEATQK